MRRKATAASLAAAVWISLVAIPVARAVQPEPGVTIDPVSPAGQEYAIPFESTRDTFAGGGGGGAGGAAPTPGANTFGVGISPRRGAGAGGGSRPSTGGTAGGRSDTAQTGPRSSNGATTSLSASERLRLTRAADDASRVDHGDRLALILLLGAVLASVGLGVALSSRRSPGAPA
jgi:hypothetical protein